MEYPTNRKAAQTLGAKYYFTGVPCKHGHIALRKTKGVCVECMKVETKASAEKRAAYFAAYNKSEAGQKAKARYYEGNKGLVIARALSRPPEETHRYRVRWKQLNAPAVRDDHRKRRETGRKATPSWLTPAQKAEIHAIYMAAIALTKSTGTPYVVDHIVPLRGKTVCGLHVPWNLQVMTREENAKKAAKLLDNPEN